MKFQTSRALIAVLLTCAAPLAFVPQAASQGGVPYGKTPLQKSRAAQEAEEVVSLSADKIIELLRDEPGLLLQVKKLLVIKAYEQGRILDPKDLTDEALFRLLRNDDRIRVLATREIEDRYYVRAKPSREEIEKQEREKELEARRGLTRTSESKAIEQTVQSKPKENQEDAYWSRHEDTDWPNQRYGPEDNTFPSTPFDPYSQPQAPSANPQAPAPENSVPENPARQLDPGKPAAKWPSAEI